MSIAVGTKVTFTVEDLQDYDQGGVIVDLSALANPQDFDVDKFKASGLNLVEVQPKRDENDNFADFMDYFMSTTEGNPNGSIHFAAADDELNVVS